MSFNDFFWMQGRPGLFFAVQASAAAAATGLLWFYGKKLRAGGASVAFTHARRKAVSFEWGTVFLLMGLFIVVGTLSEVGLIEAIAGAIRAITGGKLFLTFMAIVWISVLLSGFIDNIPYVTALVPVVLSLGKSMGSSPREVSLLLFDLLIGATVGGNITPIGASANVVAVRMLEARGHHVGFGRFMRIGVPFTLLAVTAAILFLWVFLKIIP